MAYIIATKKGMTRIHREDGEVIAVTVLHCDEHVVTGQRTSEKEGYEATIMKVGKSTKELTGDKAEMNLSAFTPNQAISIVGKTKGKGFSGTIKRYNFARGPMSHGSHNMRAPGSIGSGYPQRVVKGRKMPGRLGGLQTTIQTQVETVLVKENLLLVRGAVPGSRGTVVRVKSIK